MGLSLDGGFHYFTPFLFLPLKRSRASEKVAFDRGIRWKFKFKFKWFISEYATPAEQVLQDTSRNQEGGTNN